MGCMFLLLPGMYCRGSEYAVIIRKLNSRPDLIDSALLRPGRLDKSLFCDMPNLEDRKDVRFFPDTSLPHIGY
jgi:ATP-dependent 26S proteasome regulatory subunit